ncbi:MAG: hypothetical protein ACFE9A_20010 [Candidatus Hodarchaeota archaeon]
MLLTMITVFLLYQEKASEKTLFVRKLLPVNCLISFLSSFISIPISGLHLPSNYRLFLPFSYPLGVSYSVALEAIYPPYITWYMWLFLPRIFYPSPEFHFTLQLERAQVVLPETFFFFVFLLINTIVSISVLILLKRVRQTKI